MEKEQSECCGCCDGSEPTIEEIEKENDELLDEEEDGDDDEEEDCVEYHYDAYADDDDDDECEHEHHHFDGDTVKTSILVETAVSLATSLDNVLAIEEKCRSDMYELISESKTNDDFFHKKVKLEQMTLFLKSTQDRSDDLIATIQQLVKIEG
jgi:hypothetical protein